MTDAYSAGREAGIREAAAVASSIALPMDGKREKVQATYMRNVISTRILDLFDSPAPAGVTVPDKLYQAAKRDAEEAEAYAAELEKERDAAVERAKEASQYLAIETLHAEEAEAKLAKAVEALKGAAKQHRIIAGMDLMGASAVAYNAARAAERTLAELKGEKNE